MDEALITYSHVEVHQQELCVLSEVNLELNKGDFVYLIGKVGSGKTSLLKTFYAELGIAEGEAVVLGNDMRTIKRKHIPQLRRKLGIVFQDFQLLTDRSVYDNLEFVLRATGWKNKQEIKALQSFKSAYEYVEKSVGYALQQRIHAVVTATLHKEALNLGGYHFPGHTEILAHLAGTKDYAMMLTGGPLRVIHVSTHVALRKACDLV